MFDFSPKDEIPRLTSDEPILDQATIADPDSTQELLARVASTDSIAKPLPAENSFANTVSHTVTGIVAVRAPEQESVTLFSALPIFFFSTSRNLKERTKQREATDLKFQLAGIQIAATKSRGSWLGRLVRLSVRRRR